jgi:hypothetical protein
MGRTRVGQKEEGEMIQTIGWVKSGGGIQWEMERDRRISVEPELART